MLDPLNLFRSNLGRGETSFSLVTEYWSIVFIFNLGRGRTIIVEN